MISDLLARLKLMPPVLRYAARVGLGLGMRAKPHYTTTPEAIEKEILAALEPG